MMSTRVCPTCQDGLPTPYVCSTCGVRGTIPLTRDYIEGAKARAKKADFSFVSEEWTRGFEDMSKKLSPIETDIIKLTFQYQTVATSFVRELEESFREEPEAS